LNHLFADIIVLLHFGFIVFAIFGGLLVLKWHWIVWLHIPAVVWGSLIVLFGWICPLTPLENMLRRINEGEIYTGGFIEHYIIPIIYPPGLTREIQIAMGIFLVLLNVIVYTFVYRHWRLNRDK